MQTIYLDISNKGVYPCIQAKQEEVGRKFLAVITDNGVPYKIPDNALLSVWYEGDTDVGNYSSIEEKSAFIIDGNKVIVELVAQMLLKPGKGDLCLSVTHGDGGETNTWNIPYEVEYKPGAGSSVPTEYYTALTEAGAYAAEQATVAKRYADQAVSATENKLDQAGGTMAGDIAMGGHKVTGLGTPIASGDAVPLDYALGTFLPVGTTAEQIGAAPAGYGLGTVAKNIAQDLDTVVENGWYSYNKNACTHTPENLESMLLVENFSNQNYCKQTVTTIIGVTYIRLRYDGTWFDWRCVNPPMNLGVDYSTRKQWQGKTVYTKLVDCGHLPNNTQKNVTFTDVSTKVLRCCGQVSDGSSFPSFVAGNRIDVMGHLTQINISTNYDCSAYTGTVQVWYLKD